MKILADANIPFAREAFGTLGKVELCPGREITRDELSSVDVLIVRSVTRVDAELLHGTPVRFVGTATIGTDHLDIDYLRQHNLAYASAPGSNANSVAEYVIAGLLHWAEKCTVPLRDQTLGIVGCGNVGSNVMRKARALGMHVLVNDPPLARQQQFPGGVTPSPVLSFDKPRLTSSAHSVWLNALDDLDEEIEFLPLDALMSADIISLHTPLSMQGEDATFHLFDEPRLRRMKRGSILINTARGAVVDNQAIKSALADRWLGGAILDVWENEPVIDRDLLQLVTLGTPHIAGYSFNGKICGTEMIYHALCQFLQVPPAWQASRVLPRPETLAIPEISPDNPQQRLHDLVRQVYDIAADDERLRTGVLSQAASTEQRRQVFDSMRKEYRIRKEFSDFALIASGNLAKWCRAIGFRIAG